MAGKLSYRTLSPRPILRVPPQKMAKWEGFPAASFPGWGPQIRRKVGTIVFILAVTVLLSSSYLSAAEKAKSHSAKGAQNENSKAGSGAARYSVFSLKHISAQKGKEYLAEAKIGTASQLPGTNMLLVTAQPQELIKANAILKITDANEQFAIKAIFPASSAKDYPSNEQIAAELGDILIGTFSNPPVGDVPAKAIIDVHNDTVIAVAPVNQLERIISAIERVPISQATQLQETDKPEALQPAEPAPAPAGTSAPQKRESIEPNQPHEPKAKEIAESEIEGLKKIAASLEVAGRSDVSESESNELFTRILDSLARLEKRPAEQTRVEPSQPNEPGAVVTAPEPNVPGKPSAVSKPPKVGAKQPKERDIAAILKRLEALETGVKVEPESKVEPKIEEVTVDVEQPNEAPEPAPKVQYEPEPIVNGEDILKLDLPEKLPIEQFLGFVGEHLHLDYLYDPTKVKGDVTLRLHGKLRGDIKVKQLYPLLESVLQFHGFVMTRKDNLVTIRLKDEVDLIDPPVVHTNGGKLQTGDVIITRVFELEHIDTDSAENFLTQMELGVKVTPIADVATLIVTEYAYRMSRVEELLEMIDKPGEPKKFRFRQLKYTMATALAPKLEKLVEQLGEISITIAEPTEGAQAPVQRRPGESDAAFRRREAAARRQATRTRPRPPRAKEPAAGAAEPGVYLDFDERTNRILMIGLEDQLNVVDELIESLDVQQQDLRALRLYQIQHVDAEEIKGKLEELGIISPAKATTRELTRRTTATRAERTTQPTPPGSVTRSTPTTEETLMEEPQVIIIETINSLLVNATPEQHTKIATIIGYMDNEAVQASIPYVVYPLENQDPETLAEVLNQLIMQTTTKEDKEAKIERTTTTKRRAEEEEITIIPDKNTYSLIVYASKKNQQWINALIKQLDEYRPQVLLDVTLVEITKNEEFAFDLNLVTKLPGLDPGGVMSGAGLSAVLSPFPVERIIEATSSGVGGGKAFYADRHIQALLHFMQEKGYGRILAKPKLLVNDNQEGIIKAEEQTSIVREETQIIPGTAATAPTATTSVGFESYTAGITLTITPHISKGDQLQLAVDLNRTDFRLRPDYEITSGGQLRKGPTPPDLLTSNVTTKVTVPDGTTIILGGLERLKQSKGGTKVPVLGDIPLIGGLFRNIANTDSQSRLYIFVKAHILRPGEGEEVTGISDLEVVSAKNQATFEKYEEEMQKYKDWPGIKSTPLDPIRILESD